MLAWRVALVVVASAALLAAVALLACVLHALLKPYFEWRACFGRRSLTTALAQDPSAIMPL